MVKSPFFVVQDFLSGKMCEELISQYEVRAPNLDQDGRPTKLEKQLTPDKGQAIILEKLRPLIPLIEERYNAEYRGTEPITISHFPENEKLVAQAPGCESAQFVRRKWVKTKDIDLTATVWLKDYQDQVPLDPRFEVYGGKLEFPAYDLSLVPQRGTLVIWPAGPHFITAISPVLVSDSYQLKINIALSAKDGGIWLYDPRQFPCGKEGFIHSWFKEFL